MDFIPQPKRDPEVARRFAITFDLAETAERMMRQNLRRRFPDEDRESIERRLAAWRMKQPRSVYWGPEAPPSDGVVRAAP